MMHRITFEKASREKSHLKFKILLYRVTDYDSHIMWETEGWLPSHSVRLTLDGHRGGLTLSTPLSFSNHIKWFLITQSSYLVEHTYYVVGSERLCVRENAVILLICNCFKSYQQQQQVEAHHNRMHERGDMRCVTKFNMGRIWVMKGRCAKSIMFVVWTWSMGMVLPIIFFIISITENRSCRMMREWSGKRRHETWRRIVNIADEREELYESAEWSC